MVEEICLILLSWVSSVNLHSKDSPVCLVLRNIQSSHLEPREVVVGAVQHIVVYGQAPGEHQGEQDKQLHCCRWVGYYQGLHYIVQTFIFQL